MDLTGAKGAVDSINERTIPQIEAALREVIQDLHELLDRVNGISVVVIVPPRKGQEGK
jgi:hypothetical protein